MSCRSSLLFYRVLGFVTYNLSICNLSIFAWCSKNNSASLGNVMREMMACRTSWNAVHHSNNLHDQENKICFIDHGISCLLQVDHLCEMVRREQAIECNVWSALEIPLRIIPKLSHSHLMHSVNTSSTQTKCARNWSLPFLNGANHSKHANWSLPENVPFSSLS